ncbi:MAG: Crp/Fnr family transcriptional regulator [Bacteroidota bacterium]
MEQKSGVQQGDNNVRISTQQIANLLKSTRIFAEVDNDTLTQLAKKTEIESYKEGDEIFAQGDEDSKAYIVFSGKVGIYRDGFLMAHYSDQNIFAEFSMLDGSSYNATAQADEDCTLISLSREDFLEIVRDNSALAECVIRNLSKRLKRHL